MGESVRAAPRVAAVGCYVPGFFWEEITMDWTQFLSRPEALVFAVPIVAIVVWGIVMIVQRLIAHRERMAMIEQGLDPDHPPAEVGAEGNTTEQADALKQTRAYERE